MFLYFSDGFIIFRTLNLCFGMLSPTLVFPATYMTQDEFDELYQFQPRTKSRSYIRDFAHKFVRPCVSLKKFLAFVYSFIPILEWLPKYPWKEYILGDLMAGLTVGVIHVPQGRKVLWDYKESLGIAYAILTGLAPVYGLYTSIFAVLFYMIFGTSRYVSIGKVVPRPVRLWHIKWN